MTEHHVGARDQWQAARRRLLELEKEHALRGRDLPRHYQLLDLVASGRGNDVRVTRHDEYDDARAAAR
jgi:predicted dithiol-disulfide oxidoreductase (DUF899 family)